MFYLSTYWNSASESHGQQGQQSHLASGINISAFTFKTLLRHYAKRALTPRSLNVKLGPRRNYHKERAAIRHYANQVVVATFNQEKALKGAFSMIVQLHQLIIYSTNGDWRSER